ncbi:MAG: hypothetical protein U0R80_14170 [Nocardioidaceae bacterium]
MSEEPRDASADKYDQMMGLADLFDATGSDLRARSRLGPRILGDPDIAASAELSPRTFERLESDLRAATTGKLGLQTRSVELDADALVVRATVLTYRWIDELQDAAYRTLGTIAGRAIGYLAPEVALGGAIVSAGLIETDSLDRDDVATYLNELAESNPGLMDHVVHGGGGLLESLQMRSLLTAGVLAGDDGPAASRGGLRAAGVAPMAVEVAAAYRDAAAALAHREIGDDVAASAEAGVAPPASLEELMHELASTRQRVRIQRLATGPWLAYLPGPYVGPGRLRLVGGDHHGYTDEVVDALEAAVAGDDDPRVMLVGSAQGGVAAAQVAAAGGSTAFRIEQVVTAGSPASQVPTIPEPIQVLSLEDRTDPIALLGSLINAGVTNRTTVVFDGSEAADGVYAAGGRVADRAGHPELRAALDRMRQLGYLA